MHKDAINPTYMISIKTGSDTIALFEINTQTPENLTMIGEPVNSGGEFPISLAFNKSGKQVCVLNGGAVNGIKCVFFLNNKI